IFASIAASSDAELQSMGPIPKRQQNQLMITGTAVGSFGFQLELPNPEEDPQLQIRMDKERLESVSSAETVQLIERILRTAADGSDDDMADVLSSIHQRSVNYVRDFLEALAKSEATCGLRFGTRR